MSSFGPADRRPALPDAEIGWAAPVADWASLWRELVDRSQATVPQRSEGDYWEGRAEAFHDRVYRRRSQPDPLLDFVLEAIGPGSTVLGNNVPNSTVLDIGAGTGGWTIPLASRALRVTAVDSSPSMIEVLRRNIAQASATNIDIVEGSWPDLPVETHDYSMAAHSMYGAADLPRFVERMTEVTLRTCFLVLKMPLASGVMAEASTHLWGSPLDRPNFTVAYNVLLEMGLAPNVLVGRQSSRPRTSATMADALAHTRAHFGLADDDQHDDYLVELLTRRLKRQDDRYLWPPENQPALVYWSVE